MALNFNAQPELVYQKKIVMGITRFMGEIDGNSIDSCSVLMAAPLTDNTGNARGFGVAKVAFGKSINFQKFDGLSFPCEMELAFGTETNASGKLKDVLKDIRVPSAK